MIDLDSFSSASLSTYLVVGAIALAALLTFVHNRWVTPAKRLEVMLRRISSEQPPRALILEGAPVFSHIAQHLERIWVRQNRLIEQVAQEEYSLQAILRSMAEGVIVVDAHHTIQEVNEAFTKQFSLKTSPLKRTVLEAVRVAEIHATIDETFRSGQPQAREISLSPASPDEPPRYFDVSAIPVFRGGAVDVVAVFHDISRLKQLEDVRREFVANVSHELRTPLSIFRGYVETLIDQPEISGAELRRILETMRRHSLRLNALVDDLLTLARLESRRIVLDRVSARLRPLLLQIVADIRSKLEEKRIEIVLSIPPDLPPVEVDPFRFEQVIYNLLDNSLKYSGPGSVVTIDAAVEGTFAVIRVRDQGLGIPPNDLPHIFERFYRVDKGRSRELGGTGLGLSIVKHIVQMHGGEARAESEFGKGTTIIISLPLSGAGTSTSRQDFAESDWETAAPEPPASLRMPGSSGS